MLPPGSSHAAGDARVIRPTGGASRYACRLNIGVANEVPSAKGSEDTAARAV